MNKIGVMLGDLGASQLSYNIVTNLNEECAKSKRDFVAFIENFSFSMSSKFSSFNSSPNTPRKPSCNIYICIPSIFPFRVICAYG